MERTIYEVYGLRSNPFRDLSSESLENVDIFHIKQDIDNELDRIKEEVFYKDNKAIVAILGGLGVGKTERLLLIANFAAKNNNFYVFRNMTFETRWVVEGIIDLLIKQSNFGKFTRIFTAPRWYKDLIKIKKQTKQPFDSERAGRLVATALNNNSPSFLLINDFHNLSGAEDANQFLHLLHVLIDHIDPGVLIMISSDSQYFEKIMENNPSINERINRIVIIPPLSDKEASLMLAKRLLEKRLVDDVDPLYPFTPQGVNILNIEANGNPRHLLKLADVVIEFAAKKRAIMIDNQIVDEVITLGKNKQLDIRFENTESATKSISISVAQGGSNKPGSQSNQISLTNPSLKQQPIGVTNNPGIYHNEENKIHNINTKTSEIKNKPNKSKITQKKIKQKLQNIKKSSTVPKKQSKKIKNKPITSKKEKPERIENIETKQKKPSSFTSTKMTKLQCPDCSKIFAMELDDETDEIRCPYCTFIGTFTD
jgi:hypothetical protein